MYTACVHVRLGLIFVVCVYHVHIILWIHYVCIFMEYKHFICTVSLGTLKGAFKIKCMIIIIIILLHRLIETHSSTNAKSTINRQVSKAPRASLSCYFVYTMDSVFNLIYTEAVFKRWT